MPTLNQTSKPNSNRSGKKATNAKSAAKSSDKPARKSTRKSSKPRKEIPQKSVGAIILNPEHKVLIMYSHQNKYWEFPKGKVEKGEKELDTLKREIWEETGIERFRLHPSFKAYLRYTFRVSNILIRKVVVYYMFKTGAEIKVSDEHDEFKWVTVDEAETYLKHVNQKKLVQRVRRFIAKNEI